MASRVLRSGVANIWMILVAVIVVACLAYAGGLIPGAIDPTCQILLPQYCTFECREGPGHVRMLTNNNAYSCGLGLECISMYCDAPDMISGQMCTITSEFNGQLNLGAGETLNRGETKQYSHGALISVSYPAQVGTVHIFQFEYPDKDLKWTDWRTGQQVSGDGCDLSSISVGYQDTYQHLPVDAQFSMNPNDIQSYVCGFDAFPIWGNYVTYIGQEVICEMKSSTDGIVYDLEHIATKGAGCFYYPGSAIAEVDCCPGYTFGNQVCGYDFKWETSGGPITGCCTGGICSDVKCPGEGGWDYDACLSGPCTIYKYYCNHNDGNCLVEDTKQIDCVRDSDCSPGLECDQGTNTCVDKVVPVSCTQAGHECCLQGMFAPNVQLRTCEEAGHEPGTAVCINGECVAGTELVCPPLWGFFPDIMCLLTNWWITIQPYLYLAFIALVIGALVAGILAFINPLFRSPIIFLIIMVMIAIVLFMVFSVPLSMVGGMLA